MGMTRGKQMCSKCKVEKAVLTPQGISTGRCKPCKKVYLVERRKNHKKNNTIVKRKISVPLEQRIEYVRVLKSDPCEDCSGYFHFSQMHFDHLDPKTKVAAISKLVKTGTIEQIKTEIAKCELLCANCHSLRTYIRANKDHPRKLLDIY